MNGVWLEIVAERSKDKHVFELAKAAFSIGSAADDDVVLPHVSVRPHAVRIDVSPRGATVTKLVPAMIVLNDESMAAAAALHDGDVLLLGAYHVTFLTAPPPTGREAELLCMLDERPGDDEVRVVYSDWLEEQGRAEEAQYLRLQLSLARRDLDADGEAFLLQSTRLRGLGKRLPLRWRRAVARPAIENCDLRFELKCPKRWSELRPTAHADRRHCSACDQEVRYAATVGDARKLAAMGHCVAVDLNQPRSEGDLEDDDDDMMLGAIVAHPRDDSMR
ncbi:MAG: TIGR02996 domain-containing protein [Labilithrix sp.]|nr:TIGR02996 domain-containing protein [Labilithrix sp.]MCW5816604.1 TIGR02996 domain-containing protein [Labilithrix sp.]